VKDRLVVLKLTNVSVKAPFAERGVGFDVLGDVLYGVNVPEDLVETQEDGTAVFTLEGIRHIVRKSMVALIIETAPEDF
jgi:homoserine kinase